MLEFSNVGILTYYISLDFGVWIAHFGLDIYSGFWNIILGFWIWKEIYCGFNFVFRHLVGKNVLKEVVLILEFSRFEYKK